MMLTVADALQLVVDHAGRQPVDEVELADSAGLVLAESVTSDLDSPPFDKALMDGFAVRNADLSTGRAELTLLGELAAGAVANQAVDPGTCLQIMTGAPIPAGAEAVVMVERSKRTGDSRVSLEDPDFRPGQNVMLRGLELTAGETVLGPGHLLGAPELGLLATVGHPWPKVYRRPSLAVLSTGDELVTPDQQPGPGQIRNSNESTILALATRAGARAVTLGVARDERDDLSRKVLDGLKHDVLVLSGGVSAGKRDLVPEVLASHGVKAVFHQVALKPGKPVWFGTHENGLVFGLPGNPVSVLVCFELFVRTALRARQARRDPLPMEIPVRLKSDFAYPTRRLTYHPALLSVSDGQFVVEPVSWHGSPDLRALTAANALLVCPITDRPHRQGDLLPVLPLQRD